MNRKYTAEHIAFLTENIKGTPFRELTEMFNREFGFSLKTVVTLCHKYGLTNGRNGKINTGYKPTQFKKGMTPWNKGMKGINLGGKQTQFKKGNRPQNYLSVGSERVTRDGYAEIKIADPNKWKSKHAILWEQHNGPIPTGHVVIFADGNQRNITIENLLLISRKELAIMNKRGLIASDAELTKTGVIIADIHLKIGERKKKMRGR